MLCWLLWMAWQTAAGADWITPNNTESGDAQQVRLIGFVQPTLGASTVGKVSGLDGGLADYNGEVPLFNRVFGDGPVGVGLYRARLGARGRIGDSDFAAFLLVEMGDNGITRDFPLVVTDLAASWTPLPVAGVRVGLQKLPMMEETWPAVPVNLEFVNFSRTALRLTGENHVKDEAYDGPFSAFRDIGAQAYGVGNIGALHLGYVVMVGQGAAMILDPDSGKDVAARVQAAWVLDGSTGPFRKEVSVVAWGLTGGRSVDGEEVQRTRAGAALRVELDRAWLLAEGVYADGVVELGRQPPFPGNPVALAADGQGAGVVVSAGVRHRIAKVGRFGLKGRFDTTTLWTGDAADERVFRTITGGLEYDPIPKVRVLTTFEHRTVLAPGGSEAAAALLDQVGHRFDLQVTVRL